MGLEQLIVDLELLLAVVPARGTVKTESDNLCSSLTLSPEPTQSHLTPTHAAALHPHTQNSRTETETGATPIADYISQPPLQLAAGLD